MLLFMCLLMLLIGCFGVFVYAFYVCVCAVCLCSCVCLSSSSSSSNCISKSDNMSAASETKLEKMFFPIYRECIDDHGAKH